MKSLSKILFSKVEDRTETDIYMSFALFAGGVLALASVLQTVPNIVCALFALLLQLYAVKIVLDSVVLLRKKNEGKGMTYWQACLSVYRVSLFTITVWSFLQFLYLNFIATDYTTLVCNEALKNQDVITQMLGENTPADLSSSEEILDRLKQPINFVVYFMAFRFFGAIALSLISAIFLKKKAKI